MRVMKVCDYLTAKNTDVCVVGRNTSSFLLETSFKVKRFNLFFNRSFLFYLEYNLRFFVFGIFRKVDVILANDLDTLLACYWISKLKGAELVYDSHEYFTESIGLQGRKIPRSIWLSLEKRVLPKLKNAYTVSEPIADAYCKKYGIKFHLVRNFPREIQDIQPIEDSRFENKKVILYQGVFNAHRGLEDTILAMQFLPKEYVFILIGYGELETKLSQLVVQHQLHNQVYLLGKMPYGEMMRYTSRADLGIALEAPYGESFTYSLPNKVFDYMHVGLPFISLGTPEVKKIIDQYHIGKIINYTNSKELSECILTFMENQEELNLIRQNQGLYSHFFTWENECLTLDEIYDKLI